MQLRGNPTWCLTVAKNLNQSQFSFPGLFRLDWETRSKIIGYRQFNFDFIRWHFSYTRLFNDPNNSYYSFSVPEFLFGKVTLKELETLGESEIQVGGHLFSLKTVKVIYRYSRLERILPWLGKKEKMILAIRGDISFYLPFNTDEDTLKVLIHGYINPLGGVRGSSLSD